MLPPTVFLGSFLCPQPLLVLDESFKVGVRDTPQVDTDPLRANLRPFPARAGQDVRRHDSRAGAASVALCVFSSDQTSREDVRNRVCILCTQQRMRVSCLFVVLLVLGARKHALSRPRPLETGNVGCSRLIRRGVSSGFNLHLAGANRTDGGFPFAPRVAGFLASP